MTSQEKVYIGIDNGATGTIGLIAGCNYRMYETPVEKKLSYTKKKQFISQLKTFEFQDIIYSFLSETGHNENECIVILERPLVNPQLFSASINAVRLFQAQLTILDMMEIPYMYIDSKEWQRTMLPSGIKGTTELKLASMDVGRRLFPSCKDLISMHKDADGILIAEHARRKGL